MKKIFNIIIFVIIGLFVVKVDAVLADGYKVHYLNCQVEGSREVEYDVGTSSQTSSCVTPVEEGEFKGWVMRVNPAKGNDYTVCKNGDKKNNCSQSGGDEIFHNGFSIDGSKFKKGDVIYLYAVTTKSDIVTDAVNCETHKSQTDCNNNNCTWNDTYNFCSTTGLAYLSCGDTEDIPELAPVLISIGVTGLKTVAPIVLIIMSIIQLVRSITSGKEDDIKKAQTGLIKRVIAAVLVFFVIAIVQFIMLKVADGSEKDGLSKCFSCFLNGPGDCGSLYYKDASGNHIGIK